MMNELERVFSKGHVNYDRIFYDRLEGKYYDRGSDFYLTLDEAQAFGVK